MEDTRFKKIVLLLTIGLLAFIWWTRHPSSITTRHSDITFNYKIQEINTRGRDTLPLVFALHGNGDTWKNFQQTLFNDLSFACRMVFIQGPIRYRRGWAWPKAGSELQHYGDALAEIVSRLAEEYESPQKPILVGFSGGGCLAYYHAAVYSHLYSTIIPIAASLDRTIVAENPVAEDTAHIAALHATSDSVISYSAGKAATAFLAELGHSVELIDLSGSHLAVFSSGRTIFKQVLQNAVEKQ